MEDLKGFEPTELCEDCMFLRFCRGIDLPHCEGIEYVKEIRD